MLDALEAESAARAAQANRVPPSNPVAPANTVAPAKPVSPAKPVAQSKPVAPKKAAAPKSPPAKSPPLTPAPPTATRAEAEEPTEFPAEEQGPGFAPRVEPVVRALEQVFGVSFANVVFNVDDASAARADALGVRAFTDGRSITFGSGVFAPDTLRGRRTIAHELAHVVQLRGGTPGDLLPALRTLELAEWQARDAAQLVLMGARPRLSRFEARQRLYDSGCDGPGAGPATTDDEAVFAVITRTLATLPNGQQRQDLVKLLVLMAMTVGPVQGRAKERVKAMLEGSPSKNIVDHKYVVDDLRCWAAKDPRAYDLMLFGRLWFADRSKSELGSGLVIGAFQEWLHWAKGKNAIEFLRKRATGDNGLVANLAARLVADLLALEDTPAAQKHRANYVALRAMARENGWESFGALGAASATPRIFSALDAMRQQATIIERMVRLGPIGDPFEATDIARLTLFIEKMSVMGVIRSGAAIGFTAENRGETEHEIFSLSPTSNAGWLIEMAQALTTAVDAGIRVQERTEVLHANARALDEFLGATPARETAERLALFDLRHEYVFSWLMVLDETFTASEMGLAVSYQRALDEVDRKFEHFDEVIARRKFIMAREHFAEYSKHWNDANELYPGNDKLKEKFFFDMREVLANERQNLRKRFATGSSGYMGGTLVRVPPSDDYIPTNLRVVAALDRDTSIFGLQSAVFVVYATNLAVHNMMLKADVGSSSFREEQGLRLSTMRSEMALAWRTGNFDVFLKKAEAYQKTLGVVVEEIKDRAKIDALISIGITIIAALVTWGAALVIRLAMLSEMVAIARTAAALRNVGTLVEIGLSTGTELMLQKAFFGKEITLGSVAKSVGTNFAFLGALKAVGKFAEPFAKGSVVRQLMIGHLAGFSGVAGVSATLTLIETGHWPPDMALFLAQTAATYLLLVGMHHAFDTMAAKPVVKQAAIGRLESLKTTNQALADRLRANVDAGTLSKSEFEGIRAERIKLVEEARTVAKVLHDAGVITAAEMKAIDTMANSSVAEANGASFPAGTGTVGDPVIRALPAPENVIQLTRVGDSNTYVYDPAKSGASIDSMLQRYTDKGFTVQGNPSLRRVVDSMGRTRFALSATPQPTARLLLPEGSAGGSTKTASALERATGLGESQLTDVRASLTKVNAEMEAKLPAGYADHTVLATLSMFVEMRSQVTPSWPIDAVRGVADAMSLERGIPRSAVRRMFTSIDPAKLPDLFKAFHELVESPNVSPGTRFLIADDLLPKNSVKLIEAWRSMKAKGIELPAEMDLRATRGVARQVDKLPGGWLQWIKGIPKEKRAEKLRAVSGLTDPTVRLPANVTELLASITADLPGKPAINPTAGANGKAFLELVESQPGAGKFADAALRTNYVGRVDSLRLQVSLLEQGRPLKHGEWEGIVGLAEEVRTTASVLLSGATIHVADTRVGPKAQLPNVDLTNFPMPGGGKIDNAPKGLDVHMDLLFTESGGTLVALEVTTAELHLPAACASLDPKSSTFGSNIDWSSLRPSVASERKFMQLIKIYQLNQMARALGAAWSGGKVDPSAIRVRAGDFTVDAARAIESMGFQLERTNGVRETAASIEARKKPPKKTKP